MQINPSRAPGKNFFKVTFRNPYLKKVVTASLQTADEDIARAICEDLVVLCTTPDLWQDPYHPRLIAYDTRAKKLLFGIDFSDQTPKPNAPTLPPRDVGTLSARLAYALRQVTPDKFESIIDDVLDQFESDRYRELNQKYEQLEKVAKGLRSENEAMGAKLKHYLKKENAHVKITIGSAFDQFKKEYPDGRSRRAVVEVTRHVQRFIDSLEGTEKFRLGLVEASHVNDWLQGMKGQDEQALAPITRQHRKYYLSAFFTWACSKYDLSSHPVKNAMTIPNALRKNENIEALHLDEITTLLDALKEKPYWRAWCAFAILAGPRWGEQINLTLDDVRLNERYIIVRSNKTGRQRRVPIEQTTLLPILTTHVEARREQQKARNAGENEASKWLFPSTVPGNPYKPRELAPPGQWSSARVWHGAWERCAPKPEKNKTLPRYWTFGPREWRHSFGTALGQCGWTPIEISRAMGNSPAVCDAHYVAVAEAGKRWPFKF